MENTSLSQKFTSFAAKLIPAAGMCLAVHAAAAFLPAAGILSFDPLVASSTAISASMSQALA